MDRDDSVGIATSCYELECPGVESRWVRDILHSSRPTPAPIQPPIRCVPDRGLNHPSHQAPRLKKQEGYTTSSPLCFHGRLLDKIYRQYCAMCRSGSVVGIATGYGLDGPGIEFRWGRDFPHLSRPALWSTQPHVQWVPGLSRGVKSGRVVTLTPHPLLVPLVMKE